MSRFVTAFGLSILSYVVMAAGTADRITRTVHMSSPNLPIAVRATIGVITVTGWDRPDVAVEIVRNVRSADALTRLSAAIETDASGLHVTSVQPDGSNDPQLESLVTIHAPIGQLVGPIELFEGRLVLRDLAAGVTARVQHGSIDAASLGGAIRLETSIGDLRLDRPRIGATSVIRLRTFNGNVALGFAD